MESISSSLLDDNMKELKRKNDRYAYICAIMTQFLWAMNSIQLKTYKPYFPKAFSLNSLVFWRSLPIWIIGYIIIKKKNEVIPPINQIQHKFWFHIRSFGNYVGVLFWILLLNYFRVSTSQCCANCHPVIILILSAFILKEKFYMRYLIGVLLSLFGTFLIISNEKENDNSNNPNLENKSLLIGCLIAMTHLTLLSFINFGQKFLCMENMNGEVQNYFLGMFNSLPALLLMMIENHYGLSSPLYCLYGMSNGVIFFIANYCQTEALNYMPINRFMPITYLNIVFIFILGFLFFGEKIYLTDIIGSLMILGFQIYNIMIPIKQ